MDEVIQQHPSLDAIFTLCYVAYLVRRNQQLHNEQVAQPKTYFLVHSFAVNKNLVLSVFSTCHHTTELIS